jgi:hypothetical protein
MRRIVSLALVLILSSCGYKTWWNPGLIAGYNPNLPNSESENMHRVRGQEPSVPLLTTEPGDIWPGPLAPPPTLKDLEATGGMAPQPEAPVPGSPISRSAGTPPLSQRPDAGSSTPPLGNGQPGLVSARPMAPVSGNRTSSVTLPARRQASQAVRTPDGLAATTEGDSGYKTTVTPGSGQSIIVPNGNGTSTVIHSDGRIETIPTVR